MVSSPEIVSYMPNTGVFFFIDSSVYIKIEGQAYGFLIFPSILPKSAAIVDPENLPFPEPHYQPYCNAALLSVLSMTSQPFPDRVLNVFLRRLIRHARRRVKALTESPARPDSTALPSRLQPRVEPGRIPQPGREAQRRGAAASRESS